MEDNKENINVEEEVKADSIKEESNNEENVEVETDSTDSKEKTKEDKKAKKKSKEEIRIEKLETELEQVKKQAQEDREVYLKAKADLENVRRRVQEEAIQDRKYASMGLVSDLIQPVDMLLKASSMETEDAQMKNFLIGFQMIAGQVADILKRNGLTEIEALNKEFDPNFHQAIEKVHVDGVKEGMVVEVLQTGYKYKDRIIKPAMVKVSE